MQHQVKRGSCSSDRSRGYEKAARTNVCSCDREMSGRTHPANGSILEGVTRGSLLQIMADGEHVDRRRRAPVLSELEDSGRRPFLCGTTTGVQPLVESRRAHRWVGAPPGS